MLWNFHSSEVLFFGGMALHFPERESINVWFSQVTDSS